MFLLTVVGTYSVVQKSFSVQPVSFAESCLLLYDMIIESSAI